MPTRTPRGLPVLSVVAASAALGLAAVGRGHPPRPAAPQDPIAAPAKPAAAKAWYTASQCNNCHRTAGGQPVTDFVRLDEVKIWTESDKHSKAFEVLKDDRSKRMGELLKEAAPSADPPWGDVSADARCLSCHAPAHDAPRAKADPKLVAEGVSCASCHGADDRWIREHGFAQEEWINKTPREKADAWGMNDLRDPAVRAEVCASCHVGDASKGRVVTHAMYAAGHPPLPGLEVASFSEAEPPHWWPMKKVPYLHPTDDALKKKVGEAGFVAEKARIKRLREQYGVDQSATQHAKLVAVGGAVALRDFMKLFADTAATAKGTPDFARFDCASCHHELKVSEDSFRQARGFASDPGRPPAPDWPAALASIGIEAAGADRAGARTAELVAGLKRFHDAVGERPFGNPGKAVAEARKLQEWADALVVDLNGTKVDREAALRMLRKIASIEPPDHASARQLAWGFKAIYDEMEPKPANGAEIASTLADLVKTLGIGLTPGEQGGVIRAVGARLDADERFDPSVIGGLFGRLGALLR